MALVFSFATLCGCGTTREQVATDQLILSDAVDRSVSHIDFAPLADEKVYLDVRFVPDKLSTNLNSEYIISSLRQQMLLAGCLLQDTREDADYIVEPRIGAIGRDGHDLNFGVPGNNMLNTAATLVTSTPPLPSLPEVSLGRRTEDSAAAKIAVFAYHRESKRAVWQSGISVSKSSARNRWVLGAGPFQSGEIYGDGTHFAGDRLQPRAILKQKSHEPREDEQAYRSTAVLDDRLRKKLYNRLSEQESESNAQIASDDPRPSDERPSDANVKFAAHTEDEPPKVEAEKKDSGI